MNMTLIVYDVDKMPYEDGDYLVAYNRNVRPCVNDNLLIDNELYNVKNVTIDCDNNIIFVIVKKI